MLPEFFFEATNEKANPVGGLKPQPWSPENSMAFMDEAGIDIAVTSISTPGVELKDRVASRELARKCNDFAATLIAKYPRRFGALGSIPMPNIDDAIEEAIYALDVLRLDGLVLFTNSQGIYLGDKRMKPFFRELQKRKATIFVHPNASPDPVAHALGLTDNLIDFPGDTTRAIAQLHYQAKEYAKAISWAQRFEKEGGNDPAIRQVLTQAYYLSGDYANAAKQLRAEVEADEKADRIPSEEKLQFLASCYLKMNDNAGYATVLEKLVAHYPKKSYWADMIARVQRKPGFSDRLDLDVLRLKMATGNLSKPAEYMEMAQLALQAGFPMEAKKILDQGYASGTLGKGADAERQNRLRDLANRQAAQDAAAIKQGDSESNGTKEGDALLAIGYNLVVNGQAERGLSLMEQGLHKGGLKHPEDAKLHLALAYLQAGQKSKALQLLQTVRGNDGTADLARLWALQAGRASSAS